MSSKPVAEGQGVGGDRRESGLLESHGVLLEHGVELPPF
jgi:hypothetical protein